MLFSIVTARKRRGLHPGVGLHRGGPASEWVCIGGGLHPGGPNPGGGPASRGVGQTPPQLDTTRYGQRAGGTHPTGMHSCLNIKNKVTL